MGAAAAAPAALAACCADSRSCSHSRAMSAAMCAARSERTGGHTMRPENCGKARGGRRVLREAAMLLAFKPDGQSNGCHTSG